MGRILDDYNWDFETYPRFNSRDRLAMTGVIHPEKKDLEEFDPAYL